MSPFTCTRSFDLYPERGIRILIPMSPPGPFTRPPALRISVWKLGRELTITHGRREPRSRAICHRIEVPVYRGIRNIVIEIPVTSGTKPSLLEPDRRRSRRAGSDRQDWEPT